jgi:hypothetical protein
MNIRKLFRLLIVFVVLVFLLMFELQTVVAAPPPPLTISPSEGSTIVIPTFSWSASTGAVKYELEVGPQSDPNLVSWTAQTVHLTITPDNAANFPNAPLYWRVRAIDSAAVAGAWTSKINFTKTIPAPNLVSPADGSTSVIIPTFEWQTVEGAAYFKVELSTSPTFVAVEASFDTYNTRFTPVSTITHGVHYWRVSGVDADGHVGTPSPSRSFTKGIPAPALVSPYDAHPNIHIPTFEWQAVEGATYYRLELSTSPTFVAVEASFDTYNTRLTPVSTITHGLHYWRVSGVDADGHVGTPSASWSFTKTIEGPVLVSPGVNATIDTPTLEWQAVDGAAYYKVELSTSSTFVPVDLTLTTYNLRITPVTALALNTYYWRVSGVDADGNVGGNNWRKFTLVAPPGAIDPLPILLNPTDAQTITTDPTYQWSRVVGADHYDLTVSTSPSFSTTYSSVLTDYNSYTPAISTSPDAYPNGTYYWRVEAKTSGGTTIATSAAFSFTKQELLLLIAPVDAVTGLIVDPTYQWSQIVGAHHYDLTVSTSPSFNTTFSSVLTDYNSYTPAIASSPDAYPNGTYYWKVEAKTSGGTVIVTSEGRSFTKQAVLPLVAPADGVTGLATDPTYQWNWIVGAHHYDLTVSTSPSFNTTFSSVLTDYNSYTPAIASSPDAYPNGTYYWKVEAKTSGGTVIVTSVARSFTKQESLPLIAPANGAELTVTPTFQWGRIVGAHHYRLLVSTSPSFNTTYDSLLTDYTTYSPYSPAGRATYAAGTYYWKVEGKTSAGTTITTSEAWIFTIALRKVYLPIIIR